ncbi:TonB-dependent siderophore receptor [Niveispirillum sp. KHB5.9]|uniref:TonB-dependent siderophore receptor n=1 Tax=Niveispirillum sp. KHB5.9 TaxID=3400269 RepID=UPI003A8550CA
MTKKMGWAASVSCAALMLANAASAVAQDTKPAAKQDSETMLSEILVIGRRSESFANDKALASIRETPSSVTLIDSERLEKQNLLTLDDLLKQTAGVTVVRNISTYPRFFARGFQISSFLIDGTPQQGFASAPYSLPDLFLFDHVEFLRGPSALFSGSGSPGGSINLVRKRPKKEFALAGSVSTGSWDFYRGEIDVSTPLNDDGSVRSRVGAMIQDAGEFTDNYKKDRRNIFGAVDVDLGEETTLSVGGYYDDYETTLSTGLPGQTGVGLLDLPRDTYLGGDGNEARTKLAQGYVQLSHDFGGSWKGRATVQYNDLKRDEFYLFSRGPVTTANAGKLNMETYAGTHDADSLSGDVSLTGQYELFGRPAGLIMGGDYQRSDWKFASNYAYAQTPPLLIDVFNPVPPPLPNFTVGPNSPDYYQGREIMEQYGFYGQTRIQPIEDFTIVAGGRVGWVTYKAQDFDLTPNGIYSVDGKLSPYLGLVYDLTEDIAAYGSYADVFEPQSAFDRNGDPLGPVSGKQLEAGIKANVFSNRFLLTAAIYRIRQSNRAVADPVDVNASIASGLVQGKGFEVELNGRVTTEWTISGGYNYNKNAVLSDTNPLLVGTQFTPVTPKHSIKLFTDYAFAQETSLAGFSVGGAITLNSKQRGTSVEQDGYFVADLRAGYDFTENLTLTVNVNNMFDKKYYSEIRDLRFNNWYGTPRSAFVTLNAKY